MLSRAIAITVLMLLVSGCARDNRIDGSLTALYDNLDPLVDTHADCLVASDINCAIVSGQRLIAAYDSARPQ